MKEHPIIFSTSMVKAILDGKETMTRRVIKPQPFETERVICEKYQPACVDKNGVMFAGAEIFGAYTEDGEWGVKCPYGQPGDTLWVRETWNVCDVGYDGYNGAFEAGYPLVTIPASKPEYGNMVYYKADGNEEPPWRPSIHMPRWASRITLQITNIKVERVQDISEADALDEGIDTESETYAIAEYNQNMGVRGCGNVVYSRSYYPSICCFAELWDSINSKRGYGWDINPWVWVIEFEKVNQ